MGGGNDYREIDDRYDRMTENVNRMASDRAQQQEAAKWRDEVAMSGRPAAGRPSEGLSGVLKMLIGCVILIVVAFVAFAIIGWVIATFIVR